MQLINLLKKLTPSIKDSKAHARAVRLWLLLFVVAMGSVADIIGYYIGFHREWINVAGLCCLAVLKATLLTWVYFVSLKWRWIHVIIDAFIIGFVFLSVINGFSWIFYGFGISRKLLTIMAETNVNEIYEFLPELSAKFGDLIQSWKFWITVIGIAGIWWFAPRVPKYINLPLIGVASICGLLYLGFVLMTANWGKSNHSVYIRTAVSMKAILRNMEMMREMRAVKRALPDSSGLSSDRLASRVVIVIGESASRDHLSAYGYPLPTTPWLDTVSAGRFLFTDALGSSTSTAENIPRLLTFMTDEPTDREWYDYPTVLQLFSLLGYRTYWLSNQERSGEYSNLSGILSADADVVRYLGSQDSEDHLTYRYDDVLLPAFSKTIAEPDTLQLVFLHLMGSHFQYENRIPADRHRFSSKDIPGFSGRSWLNRKKADVIANYDNTILYTDSLLKVVVDGVEKSTEPTVVIYVSDHGENVYDDRDFRGRDPNFVHVPFVIFANSAYRNENPQVISELKESLDRPFSTSELPQLLMHLTGTRYSQYDSVRDPLSPFFRVRTRYIDGEPLPSGNSSHEQEKNIMESGAQVKVK